MSESGKQNYLHGATILAAGVVIMKILGAIYKIPLQNILGDTGYGYFNASYNIYNMLLTISTAGLPVALSRMISEAETLERPRQAQRVFAVAMVTLAVLGLLFSAAMFFFPTEMAVLFVSKAAVSDCVYALSPAVFLVCLTSAFRGYIQGHGNMRPTTIGQVLEVLVKVAVGLFLAIRFTKLGKALPVCSAGAIFGVTAGSLAALIFMFLSYLKRYKGANREKIRLSDDCPDPVGSTLWSFVRIGFAITIGASVMSLITLIDTKLIQIQLPNVPGIGEQLADELYGSYSAVQTLYNLPAAFITPMTISIVPAISAAAVRREHREVGTIAESALRISSAVAMPMGVGLAVLSVPIVKTLYPNTNALGPVILTYLGVASVFVCIALVSNAILQANGCERFPIVSMIAGGVVKIAANLLLVGRPGVNILGAAIGTICCYLVICVLNCIFIYKTLKVKPNYLGAFFRPLLSSVGMGIAAHAVYRLASLVLHTDSASGRLPMIAAMAAAIIVAVLVYLILVIVTRAITMEDMRLIPKGEKIGKLLHIRPGTEKQDEI